MKSTIEAQFEKGSTLEEVLAFLGEVNRHPEDRVKFTTYWDGSPRTIRIICDHEETTQ